MIHQQIYDMPTVRRSLMFIDRAITTAQRIHETVTSDRAQSIYAGMIKVTVDAMLLTIAAGMLTRQAFEALREWVKTHKDEDFAKLTTDRFEAAVVTVKRVVKAQRDRASVLFHVTVERIELQARDKVGDLLLTLGDKVLPQCPSGICKVNLDEV